MICITECPFCNKKNKFTYTYFPREKDKKEFKCKSWIDFEPANDKDFLWYAILNGDPYVEGHTLVILGKHMHTMIDPNPQAKEMESLILGINRVSLRLKNVLKAENVHVLCLCDGVPHLHFHLIPRLKNYSESEKKFFICNYWEREKKTMTFSEFLEEGIKPGMWYAAYQEMNYVFSDYFNNPPEKRAEILEELANKLRNPDLKDVEPFQ